MQVFRSPFKSASSKAPDQGASGSGADASAQDTSQMSTEELRAWLQSQQEAIGHLQARLESLAVAERNTVPDLTTEAVEHMLGSDKVASWMRQSGEALRDYVRSASAAPVRPSDVMGNAMECPRGDRLAYRICGIILDSQQAYAQRFTSDSNSRADPSNPLDAMSWPWAFVDGPPRRNRDTDPLCPRWRDLRVPELCGRRLLTRCLNSWRQGSPWDRPDPPSGGMWPRFERQRMLDYSRVVSRPFTGGFRSPENRHRGNHTWDRRVSVSCGPEQFRRLSRQWQHWRASVGSSSCESLKRCPSRQRAWRVIPWSYSSLPKLVARGKYDGRFMRGDGRGSDSSDATPRPAASLTCTTGAQHRTLKERPILSGYRWQF